MTRRSPAQEPIVAPTFRMQKVGVPWIAMAALVQIGVAAQSVQLANATASISQHYHGDDEYGIAYAIDGAIDTLKGWAVSPFPGAMDNGEPTAVFETTDDIGFDRGTMLVFTLAQAHTVNRACPPVRRSTPVLIGTSERGGR